MTQKLVFPKITLTERTATIVGKVTIIPLLLAFGVGIAALITHYYILDQIAAAAMLPIMTFALLFIFFGGTILSMMKDAEQEKFFMPSYDAYMNRVCRGLNAFSCFCIIAIIANRALPYEFIESYRFLLLLADAALGFVCSFVYGPVMKALVSTFFKVKI